MKKILAVLILAMTFLFLTACSDTSQPEQTDTQQTTETTEQRPTGQNGEGQNGDGQNRPEQQGTRTIGLVTEVLGNEITVTVGEMEGEQGFGGGEMQQMPSEMMEQPQNTNGGERQTGEMGERPDGETGERSEMSERPNDGAGEGGGERQGGGMSGGGMGGQSAIEGQDYSEIVTLTDETKTFVIPVGTPVTQFGTEMTFSNIAEDMYVTVVTDDEENVLSVNIMG